MPLICIGPVCIPASALLPVIAYLLGPIWRRLPPKTQQLLRGYATAASDWLQANLWDRVGWKAKAKTKAPAEGGGAVALSVEHLRAKLGSVVSLHAMKDWESALAFSSDPGMPVVVDFTADWCKPCQEIKPFFSRLAAEHANAALFVKVDVDELQEVSEAASVVAMPTFQVYKAGKLVDKTTGAREQAIREMVLNAIAH